MLEKMTQLTALYDIYSGLLTPKQRSYMEAYYHDDLSLSEIALEMGVSRNAVFDNIRRTEKLLMSYEEKLNIHERNRKALNLCDLIEGHAKEADEGHAKEAEILSWIQSLRSYFE